MRRAIGFVGLLAFVACAGADSETTARPPLVTPSASASIVIAPPPEPRADGRLPTLAKPLRYAIDLDIDPHKETFSGTVQILVDVLEETPHIVLNARGETVRRAIVKIGDSTLDLHATTRASHLAIEHDELVLSANRAIPKGRATIEIAYDAPFGKQLSGLYRANDGGESYVFTQFEAADARRAFPCFDEPGFKTAFDVAITTPTGMLALSNGVETSHVPNGAKTKFLFSTTAPIPTYLVAFAVGKFDVVESPIKSPPTRFITTHGRGAFVQNALRAATDLVPLLADYFGVAYPYDKLDLVAVPDFGAGGMENAGFITFRDDSVLFDDHASLRQKRNMIGLMAHELAHQWFGDLVTMKWWDDLRLNEGFATWTTYKIVDTYKPAFGTKIDAASSAAYIMDQDGLASARAIRQPVASVGQAMEAFDGITYQKGAAVLRMIEHYVGDDVFRAGVHSYLSSHAFGNATADDLLGAIDAAGKNTSATDIARAYLDRPGVPLVVVDSLDCAAKSFRAHEERFTPLGASFATSSDPWKVPLCIQGVMNAGKPQCSLLTAPTSITLTSACPVIANPDAIGYYRVAWPENALSALAKKLGSASAASRVSILADAWAQTRAGKLDPRVLMRDVLPAIDHETERHAIERLVSVLYELSEIVDDATWPAFSAYVRARLAPHIARLDRAGDKLDDDQRLLRRTLVYTEVDLGEDAALLKKLEGVAKSFRANDKGVDPDYGQVALELSARTADPAELRRAVETSSSPQAHVIALRAAAGVIDPAAVTAQLDWMLSPAVKLQDVRGILWPLLGRHRTRALALSYAHAHWDALREKLPGALSRGLVGMAGYACTPAALDEARAFYTQKTATLEGAERLLAQALESASLCVALRNVIAAPVKAALSTTTSSSGAGAPARR